MHTQTQEQKGMTAEQAVRFSSFSETNYRLLKASLPCGCEPYTDVFTYRRWQAQGFQVRKGEKAHKIGIYIEREVEETSETGEVTTKNIRRPWTAHVFCRCQVDKKG